MYLIRFILIIFFINLISSCQKNIVVNEIKPQFENMTFDVVEKKIFFKANLPQELEKLAQQWFNQNVKVNGIEGSIIFNVLKYDEMITSTADGRRIDLTLGFVATLEKPSLSQTSTINGEVSSFSSIDGDYSLADFDIIIKNTQIDLITRLSKDLKSKI